jgi:hypothetical protein
MTELCKSCLGCNQLEDENFNGVYICESWVNGDKAEDKVEIEQMRMEGLK